MMNTELPTNDAVQDAAAALMPVTERLLTALPGPRWRWELVWSLTALLQVSTYTAIPFLSRFGLRGMSWDMVAIGLAQTLVWGYAIWMSLRCVAMFARDVQEMEGKISALTYSYAYPTTSVFRGMESVVGPMVLATVLTVVFGAQLILAGWWALALLSIPIGLLVHLPVTTWFWNYMIMMLGLDRLGKQRLTFGSYTGDKSMGLRPVGSLAFRGIGMFSAILGPIVLLGVVDVLGLTVGLLFFVLAVVAFFLSLLRIHRQMVKAREVEMAGAQELYAKAYEPLRVSPSLELLGKQAPLLSAAEALARRIEGIQTWPFSDAILARIVVIVSSVVTAILVKLLLRPLGL